MTQHHYPVLHKKKSENGRKSDTANGIAKGMRPAGVRDQQCAAAKRNRRERPYSAGAEADNSVIGSRSLLLPLFSRASSSGIVS